MAVYESSAQNIPVLTFEGKLIGGSDTNELRDKVSSLIQSGIIKIIIDLGKVKWINSYGLGILISCYMSIINKNGEIKLVGASDKVKSLFEIAKLINIFKNYNNVDEALKSFSQ